MPKSASYDLSTIRASIITFSDRVLSGEKEDRAAAACSRTLVSAGLPEPAAHVVAEQEASLKSTIRTELEAGARLILILGGSGFGVGNCAPEVVRSFIEVEIPGIAEQIRANGLKNTSLSGLSREVVGVTARDSTGALIVSSPGSKGGALDTLEVVVPLLPAIYTQLDERR